MRDQADPEPHRLGEITVDPKTVTLAKPVDTSAAPTGNLTGKWTLVADAGGQIISIAVEFKQTGSDFTGATFSQMGNGTITGGKISGKEFTGTLNADINGQIVTFGIAGTLDSDKMSGTFSNPGFGSVPFTATRDK